MQAQRRLGETSHALGRSFERLSSGQRINRAADDAAGLAISSSLNATAKVLGQGIRNVNDGVSYLGIAQGALEELSAITTRKLELAEQSANGSYSAAQRQAMSTEANALVQEFNRIVETAQFNGRSVIDVKNSSGTVRIQAGFGVEGSLSFALGSDLARQTADGTFQGVTTQTPGFNGTTAMSLGDLNGDENVDVILSSGSSDLTIALGNGDGTFRGFSTYVAGISPASVIAADVNSDSVLDLITGDEAGGLSVLIGNGNGTFKAASFMLSTSSPYAVTTGDFNGDGFIDIANSDSSGVAVGVLLGNNDGSFKARQIYSGGTTGLGISSADLNGDGRLDLMTADFTTSTVSVLLGNGNGTFLARRSFTAGNSPFDLVTGDFNGDNQIDIATADSGSGSLSILLGNGNGTFAARRSYAVAGGARAIRSTDLNDDGRADLISANFNNGSIDILYGNGDGSFLARRSLIFTGATPQSLVVGDFNSDGVTDIVSADESFGLLGIFLASSSLDSKIANVELGTPEGARQALDSLYLQLQRISKELGSIGAFQSRLETALANLASGRENYLAASSRIQDIDLAEESATVVRRTILQQTTAAVLAQANQQPALALRLLS